MKIGLIDVDGHNFPNLALMKISAYHKSLGDTVEWHFPMSHYDKVYMSKVFTDTPDYQTVINADEVIMGGTGYRLDDKLPPEIETTYPDYSLYNITDTAYGYLTRGCLRGCGFCIVAEKEGRKSVKVANLGQFWRGQKEIMLLDTNLLACPDHMALLQQLVDSKAWVDFTQGLDARLLTPENEELIKLIRVKQIHFAWDNPKDNTIPYMLWHFKRATGIDRRKAAVYVLTNYNSTFEQDLDRVYKLRDLGYWPYVMVYERQNAPKNIKQLQRWVNNRFVFEKCERFEDYQKTNVK